MIRHTLRSFRHSPITTVVALLTLAIGIGLNTAIFAVIQSVLLADLPYRDPSRLVAITGISASTARELRTRSRAFDHISIYGDAIGLFGVIAVGLAAIGIFGVVSYSVAQRTQELGVRAALGASPHRLLLHVFGGGFALTIAGLAGGFMLSLATTRLLSAPLFGVSPIDPLTTMAAALVLVTAATMGIYIPARAATRIDPLTALRQD